MNLLKQNRAKIILTLAVIILGIAAMALFNTGCTKRKFLIDPRWQQAVIAEDPEISGLTASTIDSRGKAHVVFLCGKNKLKYAKPSGNKWKIEDIKHGKQGEITCVDIVLDKSKKPAIVFALKAKPGAKDKNMLIYGEKKDGKWKINKVENNAFAGTIEIDNKDIPHVCYITADNKLKIAEYKNNKWKIKTIDEGPILKPIKRGPTYRPALGFDYLGHGHVAYPKHQSESLNYASDQGVGWRTQTVQTKTDMRASFPSLTVIGRGQPHVAYQSSDAGGINYAYKENDNWNVKNVNQPQAISPSLDVYKSSAAIAFFTHTHRKLMITIQEKDKWKSHMIEDRGQGKLFEDVPANLEMTRDSRGRPNIVYADPIRKKLFYLRMNRKAVK